MAAWQHGSTAAWQHGSMAAWQHGSMAAWQHGSMAANFKVLRDCPAFGPGQELRQSQSCSVLKCRPISYTSTLSLLTCSWQVLAHGRYLLTPTHPLSHSHTPTGVCPSELLLANQWLQCHIVATSANSTGCGHCMLGMSALISFHPGCCPSP